MTKVKRNFKDSLFRLVFHGKEELLSLYNAVNGSSYTNADDLEINTLEDVVYMGMKNDVSFLFAHYLNLYEAQSTSNPNMPLRGTIYFGDLLKGWIESNHLDMYSEKQIMIPKPKFLVFYNGLKKEPERRILRLSDSFEGGQDEEAALECTAIMLNINYGYNQKLMEKCQTLGIDREIGVLQQLRGDGGLVGIIVVHDVHCDSSFDFEKLCLKGGLDGLVSLSPSRRQFLIVCQVARKNFGRAEGPLYNQRTFFLKNLAPFFKKLFLPLILPLLS